MSCLSVPLGRGDNCSAWGVCASWGQSLSQGRQVWPSQLHPECLAVSPPLGCCFLPVVTLHPHHKALVLHLEKMPWICGHSVPAAGQGCRSFTLQSLDEVEGILLMQHPWRLLRGCAGKSVRGFVPRSMPLEDRWAVPRFLPGLGGASGCTSTGLLVLFPLNLRQSPPRQS